MQRDFKVGLVVGVIALLGALIWLASRESLSPEARLEKQFKETQTQAQVPQAQAPKAQAPKEPALSSPTTAKQQPQTVSSLNPTLRSPNESNEMGPVDLATSETRPKIETQRFHIVREGETLSQISQRYYGSVRYVDKIMAANEDVIKNANLIYPGMRLIIPKLDETP